MNNRTCWQCPNPATNPETAPIAICDKCFDRLQEHLKRVANEPGGDVPLPISATEYMRRLKELKNEST